MGSNEKVSAEIKLQAVEDYMAAKKSSAQISEELGIQLNTFLHWLRKYKLQGSEGLLGHKKFIYYPPQLKEGAVHDYLSGGGSLNVICLKYGISCHSVLQDWIRLYNEGHEDFKSRRAREEENMVKGRKTTYEERVQIAQFCVEHTGNYLYTCEQFQVSYQQIYSWANKYQAFGLEGLIDRRGKRKEPSGLSEDEKKALQLRQLEAENQRLKMENDYLKKLNEVERGRKTAVHTSKASIKPYVSSARKKGTP